MTDFRETKIRILSEEHSRAFQEAVIAAGGGGPFEKYVKCLSAKFLFVAAVLHLGYVNSDSDYFDRHQYKEIQFPLPTKGHPHAELMAQYAEDAKTTDKPWELYQIKTVLNIWKDIGCQFIFDSNCTYRRNPKTHIVHGVEIPDLRFTPKTYEEYYFPYPNSPALAFRTRANYAHFNAADEHRIKYGLCYEISEEGRQAAMLHAKAMLGDQS